MKFYMESHPLILTFKFLDAYVMQLTSHPCTNLTYMHVDAFLLVILLGRKVIVYMTLIQKKIFISRDVIFHEHLFPFSISPLEDQSDHPVLPMPIDEVVTATPSTLVESLDSLSSSQVENPSSMETHIPTKPTQIPPQHPPLLRRFTRSTKMLTHFNDYQVNHALLLDHGTVTSSTSSTRYPLNRYVTYSNFSTAHKKIKNNISQLIEQASYE